MNIQTAERPPEGISGIRPEGILLPPDPAVAIDFETSGLDSGSRILSVGLCRTESLERFHSLVEPGENFTIPRESIEIHGITREILDREKPPEFPEILERILKFCGDFPLLAHNAGFDLGMLQNEMLRTEISKNVRSQICDPHRWTDSLELSRRWYSTGRHGLEALAGRLGIQARETSQNLHDAGEDAEILARCWQVWRDPGNTNKTESESANAKSNLFQAGAAHSGNPESLLPENLPQISPDPERSRKFQEWLAQGAWKGD